MQQVTLIHRFDDGQTPHCTRSACRFGPALKVAVPGLADLLQDEDFMVREQVVRRLAEVNRNAIETLPHVGARRRMRNSFPGALVVPIHLDDWERFVELFDNMKLHDDKEWWEV